MRRIASRAGLALALLMAFGAAAPARAQTASDYTTYYQWDTSRRVTMKIGPDPDGSNLRPDGSASAKRSAEKYTYDANGQLIQTDVGTVGSVAVSASGVVTVSGWTPLQTILVRYDAAGNATQVYADAGTTAATLAQTSYDAADQPLCAATRMNAGTFQAQYDASATPDACALTTAGTQGADRITKTVYDAAGQTLQTLQGLGTADQRTYAAYTYTSNGKQATITDANSNLTTLTYDGFDRLVQQTFPSTTRGALVSNAGDYERYDYDAADNHTALRKRDGGYIRTCYDALGRDTIKRPRDLVDCTSTTGAAEDVYTAYDLLGHKLSVRFGSTSGQGVVYGYDTAGRPASETTFGRALAYVLDKAGNRTRLTWPDNNYASFGFDAASHLSTAGAGPVVTFGYDDLGRRVSVSRTGGATSSYGYDPAGRLASFAHDLASTASDIGWTYGYNPASQVTSRGLSNTAYQWTGYNGSLTAAADGLNRDGAIAAASGYDANQNLKADGVRTMSYDAENRLKTVSGPAGAALEYDPLGRLSKATIDGTITQYLYDGDKLTLELDGAGTILRRYLHGTGTDEPLIWFEGAGFSDPRYLHGDAQGSIVAWSNASGAAGSVYAYGPYGEPGDNWAAGSRFRYTGQIALPELKLYHYKARVYDPMRGWFLQTDPIGYKDDLNLYAYTGGDPVNGSDPTGTSDWKWDQATAAARGTGALSCSGNCTGEGASAQGGGIGGNINFGARASASNVSNLYSQLGRPGDDQMHQFGAAVTDAGLRGITEAWENGLVRIHEIASLFMGGGAVKGGTVTIYRAVGVREFESVMASGAFRAGGNSLEGRQFAMTMEEALAYARTDPSKVEILRVTISRSALKGMDFSRRIDPFIFKNGVITVQPGIQNKIFNESVKKIESVFH